MRILSFLICQVAVVLAAIAFSVPGFPVWGQNIACGLLPIAVLVMIFLIEPSREGRVYVNGVRWDRDRTPAPPEIMPYRSESPVSPQRNSTPEVSEPHSPFRTTYGPVKLPEYTVGRWGFMTIGPTRGSSTPVASSEIFSNIPKAREPEMWPKPDTPEVQGEGYDPAQQPLPLGDELGPMTHYSFFEPADRAPTEGVESTLDPQLAEGPKIP